MTRSLYVLLSRQSTKIGRVIRVFLRDSRYTHVSVSLDSDLAAVYSFSRRLYRSPFSGGFVREYPAHFILHDRDIDVKLCRAELDEEGYAHAMAKLEDYAEHPEKPLYNLYDAAALPFKRRVIISDAYTCVGFAAELVGLSDEVSDIGELEARLSDNTVYEGSLKAFLSEHGANLPEPDLYFDRVGLLTPVADYFRLRGKLSKRKRSDKEKDEKKD